MPTANTGYLLNVNVCQI